MVVGSHVSVDISALFDLVNNCTKSVLEFVVLALLLVYKFKHVYFLSFADVQLLIQHLDLHFKLFVHFLEALSGVDLICEINFQLVQLSLKVPGVRYGLSQSLLGLEELVGLLTSLIIHFSDLDVQTLVYTSQVLNL